MAKTPNNFAANPHPSDANSDYVEMDRFPPRRGNQKEVRRTVAILTGALVVLVTGLVLRPLVAPDVAQVTSELPPPTNRSNRPSRVSGTTGPIETRIPDKDAKTAARPPSGYSPFDTTAPATTGLSAEADAEIAKTYDPFAAPSSTTPAATPAPPSLPGAVLPTKPTIYGAAEEPPTTPSLSRTGGVYKPADFATPPPAPGAVPFGGNSTTGTNGTSYLPTPVTGTGGLPAVGSPYTTPRFP